MQKETIFELKNISKSFFGVKALKDVSFDIRKGEILGLLGANGAGKSTALKIIGGVQKADNGSIILEGNELLALTPHSAKQKGIVSVYQELNLFLNMTVAENLFIGKENKSKAGMIDWKTTRKKAQEILDGLGLGLNPDAEVASLSVAQQHMVEIARAIREEPKLLLLDEPTAALSENEIQWLFGKVRELVSRGTTVVYVSHRLDEVVQLCDRCAILRDGQFVAELSKPFNKDDIVCGMIGHSVELRKEQRCGSSGDVVFECQGLSMSDKVRDVSFSVKRGEILGIAGLVGAGRTELLELIFGVGKRETGAIRINGKEVDIKSPQDAIAHGITLIPEDRKIDGLFLSESVRFNIASMTIGNRAKAGFVREREEKNIVRQAAGEVGLDAGRLEDYVKLLSGGNQQKAVIAKALLTQTDVLLMDEPTRGVDIGAREEIYQVIKTLADQGKAIVLVSSDWEELTLLSDRMLVMAEGRITGELCDSEISQEKLLHLSTIANVSKQKKEVAEKQKLAKLRKFLRTNNTVMLFAIVVVFIAVGLIAHSSFRTWENTRNLMGQAVPYLLLTVGQLVAIIAGGLDLSVGALLAASCTLGMSIMIDNPAGIVPGVLAMLGLGLVTGAVNGFLVVKAKIDSFVATLGISIVLEGLALIISNKPIGPSPQIFMDIAGGDVLGIPNVLLIIVVVVAVFSILLRYTSLGRGFFAVGENAVNSYWAGLPVNKIRFLSFFLCSFMAVIAAIFMLGRMGAGDPTVGPGMELDSIACALIGGALLGGGRGSLAGAVCGVFVLVLLSNILSLMEVQLWYQQVVRGTLLLVIIISYEKRVRSAKHAIA